MMYIKSNRGGEKFIDEGYMYVYDKTSTDRKIKFWRCEYKSDKCRARLHTSVETNEVVKRLNDHNHLPNPHKIVETQMRALLKRKPEFTNNPEVKIEPLYEGEVCEEFNPLDYIKDEPEIKILRAENVVIKTEKVVVENSMPLFEVSPKPVDDILTDEQKTYFDEVMEKKLHFLIDNCDGSNEILIFGREDYKDWSKFMKTIYIDSSFKGCPHPYNKMCIIMAERDNFVITVLYALLKNARDAFRNMFARIRYHWPDFEPEVIKVDLNKQLLGATKRTFPNSTVKTCFSFLRNAFFERLSMSELIETYDNEREFSIQAKMILALAFVRREDLEEAMTLLKLRLCKELSGTLKWFEDNFYGRQLTDRASIMTVSRNPPQYDFEFWSLHEEVKNGKMYTNNALELVGAHSVLEANTNSVSQFIMAFQMIQKATDPVYESFVRGESSQMENLKSRLPHLLQTYKQRTLFEFLRGVACNID